MLSQNVTANLDYLASLGILDYDAAAHIAGSAPRYFGSPRCYVPPTVMTPLDYTTFSYNRRGNTPFNFWGQNNGNGISWKTIFGGGIVLGGLYLLGNVFLATMTGIENFSLKGLLNRGKKNVRSVVEDFEIAAHRGGKRVRKTSRNIATKLGIRKPWYKRVGNAISNGFGSITKTLRNVRIR